MMKFTLPSAIVSLVVAMFLIAACNNVGPELPDDDDVEVIANPDPLSLWNDSPTKTAILDFVESVSDEGSIDFVPQEDRIAVFDNDGTLWCEMPLYFQLLFGIDLAIEEAKKNPALASREPFKSLMAGDLAGALKGGESAMIEIIMVSHSGLTVEQFDDAVERWLATARHPRFEELYNQLTFSPMVELLLYMREKGFQTFIVSGGGIDFVRQFSESAYGIPTNQVIGSSVKKEFQYDDDGIGRIYRLPEIFFVDDKAGKPVGIHHHIGRRPIAAFGNSDGDYEMIDWVTSGSGPSLGAFVHHTDSIREYAYDREGHIGVLNRGLDDAKDRGWIVIDMAKDWKKVF